MKKFIPILTVALLTLAIGCRDSHRGHDHDHDHDDHGHFHEAPHGGTPIVLGEEEFHLELLHDPKQGKMTAYVLDGHLEDFVRIEAPSFEIAAEFDGRTETLSFQAMASGATGETVGDTAQFDAQADWLRDVDQFKGTVRRLEVKGRVYENIAFPFPEGHELHHD